MKHKIKILRVSNVEHVQKLTALDKSSKSTAKAALRYQKQTANVDKKIHAIGIIAKSIDTQLQTIASVDEREFATLTDVIDGQIVLTKQAKELDEQWNGMIQRQIDELNALSDIHTSLQSFHQSKVESINGLHHLAEENHTAYIHELTTVKQKVNNIANQISTLNTKEDITHIEQHVKGLQERLETESTLQHDYMEKMEKRMSDLRTVAQVLLTSSGHYTNVIQTLSTKIAQLTNMVDVVDEKVSNVSPVLDQVTESDLVQLFSELSENARLNTESTENADVDEHADENLPEDLSSVEQKNEEDTVLSESEVDDTLPEGISDEMVKRLKSGDMSRDDQDTLEDHIASALREPVHAIETHVNTSDEPSQEDKESVSEQDNSNDEWTIETKEPKPTPKWKFWKK